MVGNSVDRYVFDGDRAIQNARSLLDAIDLDDAVQLEIVVHTPRTPDFPPIGADDRQPPAGDSGTSPNSVRLSEMLADESDDDESADSAAETDADAFPESYDEFVTEGVTDESDADTGGSNDEEQPELFPEPTAVPDDDDHDRETDGYKCSECDREFNTRQGLSGHLKAHRSDHEAYQITGAVSESGRLTNHPDIARDVLGVVADATEPSSGDIADELGVDRGDVSKFLTPLYQLRYVDRESHALDGGSHGWEYRYTLTDRGQQVYRWLSSSADASVFSLPPEGIREN